MCFTICKKTGQVGRRPTALLNVMLTNQRLNGDEAVSHGGHRFSNMSRGPVGILLLGLLHHMQEQPSSPVMHAL